MSKVYAFFATGYEEVEALTVVDLLRRAAVEVNMVSMTGEDYVVGSHGISINMDSKFDDNNYRVVGTLFNTYILVEQDNSLLVIDQHAGHERLLFDKFNAELSSKSVAIQPLIVPFILETNYNESAFISENLDIISQLGFDIEEFGENSFKISSVPLLFDNIDLESFFANILSDLNNKLIISKNDAIKEYLAKKACRIAVKGNDKLTTNEINELLKQINQPNQILLCPHGRPIIIDIDKKEIEKWFKRIVWYVW